METLPAHDKPDLAPRQKARALYWRGYRIARIAEMLGEKAKTLHSWKNRDKWDDALPLERVEGTLEARLIQLIAKEKKEGIDFKEIDLLGRQIERMARVHKYNDTGKESDLNPNIEARNEAPRTRKTVKNDIGEENTKLLLDAFHGSIFDYQRGWYRAGIEHRIRNILKSRQIGATWYFAREAVCDAFENGRNKIFMSASKAQAYHFRRYIIAFVQEITGVELKGDPIVLPNGASLYFLGTNANTAQGYHGDTYLDEYFWIQKFQEFRKVSSGMAMHKKWRQTYFSTPSSIAHEAYPFWTGDQFNKKRPKAEQVSIDVSHEALMRGRLCEDRQWRQIVTVEDAVRGGCDLFDLDELRLEYSQEEYGNLLMCQFVDDSQSIFPLSMMQTCMVDAWEVWRDFKPFTARPMGDAEVWLGYDADGGGEDGDGAGLVALAKARNVLDRHRIVEKVRLFGMDYEQQADEILRWCNRYNVTHIGMDATGIGDSVAHLVEVKKPGLVKRHIYSPDVKYRMILKAQNVIDRKRLQFDSGDTDIAHSFMAIRRTMTKSGQQMTYKAGRNRQTGHAELAWATMHALMHEPLEIAYEDKHTQSLIEIYE
jgi:uncharacterized protein YjcR